MYNINIYYSSFLFPYGCCYHLVNYILHSNQFYRKLLHSRDLYHRPRYREKFQILLFICLLLEKHCCLFSEEYNSFTLVSLISYRCLFMGPHQLQSVLKWTTSKSKYQQMCMQNHVQPCFVLGLFIFNVYV